MNRYFLRALAAYLLPTFVLGYLWHLVLLAWSFTTLPVAAKYDMTSIPAFLTLESAFTAVQFLIVAPLMALAYRGSVARVIRLRPDRPLARTG